jgi:hypothetical protein
VKWSLVYKSSGEQITGDEVATISGTVSVATTHVCKNVLTTSASRLASCMNLLWFSQIGIRKLQMVLNVNNHHHMINTGINTLFQI